MKSMIHYLKEKLLSDAEADKSEDVTYPTFCDPIQ